MSEGLTLKEINEVSNKIFLSYMEHYKAGKMSFAEYCIVESVIMKIQVQAEEYLRKKGGLTE